MSSTQFDFQELVEKASNGEISLPEFQRDFKWKRRQIILLFDSLRSGFPLGSLLLAGAETFNQAKPFQGAETTDTSKSKFFVLDGQQRLTAGIQLFKPNLESQNTFYFIDIVKVQKLLKEWADIEGKNVDDDSDIDEFGAKHLEADDSYLVGKVNVKDPWGFFVSRKLLFTPYLLKENDNRWDERKEEYLEKHPEDKKLIQVIQSLFRSKKDYNPSLGAIIVDEEDPRTLSRIFATLNSTGIPLSSFEITVSEMWGEGVRLLDDIEAISHLVENYDTLDPNKTNILQLALMLAGQNHKKANLPKELSAPIWNKFKDDASEALNKASEFLIEDCGCPVDHTLSFIPYEPALLPIAFVLWKSKELKLDTTQTIKILQRYFFDSALTTRYTEGVHNKQSQDAKHLILALKDKSPDIVFDNFDRLFSGAVSISRTGAPGKAALCFFNKQKPIDPLTGKNVYLGAQNSNVHHIFPQKLLGDWGIDKRKINGVTNLMLVSFDTNRRFTNHPPHVQIDICKNEYADCESALNRQFITSDCVEILRRPNPSRADFDEFIGLRGKAIDAALAAQLSINVKESADDGTEEIDNEDISD